MRLVVGGFSEGTVYGGDKPYWDTSQLSRGLRSFALSPSGKLLGGGTAAADALPNPGWVAAHPTGRAVYSACESSSDPRGTETDVVAHAIDPSTGKLTFINRVVCGDGGCFASVSKNGLFLLVSCIGTSEVVVFPILPGGGLASAVERRSIRAALGLAADVDSNAHSVVLSPSNRLAVVSDLALARVLVYRFDSERGSLKFHSATESGTYPGGRARHLVFQPVAMASSSTGGHDSAPLAFGMNQGKGGVDEGSVSVYTVHEHRLLQQHGKPILELVERVSSLPEGHVPSPEQAAIGGAAIQVSSDGRHLYCSNRGDESIAMFRINHGGNDGGTTSSSRNAGRRQQHQYLTLLGHVPCGGLTPRDIKICGNFLLVANQDSHNVVTLAVDQGSGLLRHTGHKEEIAAPNCICLLPSPSPSRQILASL